MIFCRILEILLTNWKNEKCIIVTGNYGDQEPKFATADTKLHVPVVTLPTQDNEKLLR